MCLVPSFKINNLSYHESCGCLVTIHGSMSPFHHACFENYHLVMKSSLKFVILDSFYVFRLQVLHSVDINSAARWDSSL